MPIAAGMAFHAELITFGLKIASWFAENQRNMARFGVASAQVSVGPAFRRNARWVRLKLGSIGGLEEERSWSRIRHHQNDF